jgi:hypothetical protein
VQLFESGEYWFGYENVFYLRGACDFSVTVESVFDGERDLVNVSGLGVDTKALPVTFFLMMTLNAEHS